jgi:hypothetical protein
VRNNNNRGKIAMTDYNVTVGKALLPELLSGQDGLAKLIESVLNQVLEAQVRGYVRSRAL